MNHTHYALFCEGELFAVIKRSGFLDDYNKIIDDVHSLSLKAVKAIADEFSIRRECVVLDDFARQIEKLSACRVDDVIVTALDSETQEEYGIVITRTWEY